MLLPFRQVPYGLLAERSTMFRFFHLAFLFGIIYANEVCYPDLGCFDNGPPFWDVQVRPVSLLPSAREDIDTKFFLNTPTNPQQIEEQLISNQDDLLTIRGSDFDPSLKTIFIIHGYLEIGDLTWMTDMADALLTYGHFNVFRVVWDTKPGNDHYAKMTSNARIVGAEIALLIDQLMFYSYGPPADSPSSYHLIGRGIGAHVAGYAGERHYPRLGRISGLDPAGPYFEHTDLIVRLDHTDAEFVDVIHTNGNPVATKGMGLDEATGHADFYPNGGNEQPACPSRIISILFLEGTLYEGGVQYVLCDHEKAHEMYMESILSGCRFLASPAYDSDIAGYMDGEPACYDVHHAMPMGFHADKSFMMSDSQYFQKYLTCTVMEKDQPHCKSQYRAEIFFSDGKGADEARGDLYLQFGNGIDQPEEKVLMSNSNGDRSYQPGHSYTVTGIGSTVVDPLTKIRFSWDYDSDWYNPISWKIIRSPDVYVHYIKVDSLDVGQSLTFYSSAEDGLVRGNERGYQDHGVIFTLS